MQARYYDPVDAATFLLKGNVQGFNRYAYANNNPFKFTDPYGRTAQDIHAQDIHAQESNMWANSFGYENGADFTANLGDDVINASSQLGNDVSEVTRNVLTSNTVQDMGDTLGYIPTAPTQAISTLINTAALLDGDAAGLAGDVAGKGAEAQAEKSHAGKGGSPRAMAFNYMVDKATGLAVSSTIEIVQEEVKE